MTPAPGLDGELPRRLAVRGPRPRLSRPQELALTSRQREVLDALDHVVDGGFAELTMAELARRVSCSLRTRYSLAPSRNELGLVVVDRRLWRVGRAGRAAVVPGQTPLEVVDLLLAGPAATPARPAGDVGLRPATPPARRCRHRFAAPVPRSV